LRHGTICHLIRISHLGKPRLRFVRLFFFFSFGPEIADEGRRSFFVSVVPYPQSKPYIDEAFLPLNQSRPASSFPLKVFFGAYLLKVLILMDAKNLSQVARQLDFGCSLPQCRRQSHGLLSESLVSSSSLFLTKSLFFGGVWGSVFF